MKNSFRLTISTLILADLSTSINQSIINIAIPDIGNALSIGFSIMALVINGSPLSSGALVLFSPIFATRFSKINILKTGLIIVFIFSLLSTLAQNATQLIACRVLIGAGSALVMPTTLAYIYQEIAENYQKSAVSYLASATSLGFILAPIIGGWILTISSWRFIFIPASLLALLALWMLQLVSKVEKQNHVNVAKVASTTRSKSMVKEILVVYGLAVSILIFEHGVFTDNSLIKILCMVFSIAGMVVSVGALKAFSRGNQSHLFPKYLFQNMQFISSFLTYLSIQFINAGILFVLPQYLQSLADLKPGSAGLMMIPIAIANIISASNAKRISSSLGNRRSIILSLGATAIGVAGMAITTLNGASYEMIVLFSMVAGFSGLASSLATYLLIASYQKIDSSSGSSLKSGLQRFGIILGTAITGSMMTLVYRNTIRDAISSAESVPASFFSSYTHSLEFINQANGQFKEVLSEAAASSMKVSLSIGLALVAVVAMLAFFFNLWISRRPKSLQAE